MTARRQAIALLGLTATAVAGPASAADAASRPVTLVAQSGDRGVVFRVVGEAPVETRASYKLEIDGRSGNRVRQASSVRILPGAPETFSTVSIGSAEFRARLLVSTSGRDYEIVIESGSGTGQQTPRS